MSDLTDKMKWFAEGKAVGSGGHALLREGADRIEQLEADTKSLNIIIDQMGKDRKLCEFLVDKERNRIEQLEARLAAVEALLETPSEYENFSTGAIFEAIPVDKLRAALAQEGE